MLKARKQELLEEGIVVIGISELHPVVQPKSSLVAADCGEHACPWSCLQSLGLSLRDINDNYSGKMKIYVSQGSVRETKIPTSFKLIFKEQVMPSIQKSKPTVGDTFHLLLHFRDRSLKMTQIIMPTAKMK